MLYGLILSTAVNTDNSVLETQLSQILRSKIHADGFIAAERASLKRASAAAILIYAVGEIYLIALRRIALW